MEATKKLAPPGRRTSAKREAFKAENDDTTTVPTSSTQPAPDTAREEAARNQLAMGNQQKQQRALEEERRRREEEDRARQREEEARNHEESRRALERERLMIMEQQAALAARNAMEEARAAAEAARVNAAASQQLSDDAIKARERERQAEVQRLEQAIASERQALDFERQARLQEELQRQRRETEEREIQQHQMNERLVLERQAEKLRRDLETANEAEAAAFREAKEAEERQLELERLRREAIERARLEQQQQQQETSAAELEAKRKAEEQRKKRAAFLSGMDSFAVSFEQQAADSEAALRQAQQEEQRLARDIASLPAVPGSDPVDRKKKDYVIGAEEIALPQPTAVAAVVEKEEVSAVPAPSLSNVSGAKSSGINSNLTQSLFGSSSSTTNGAVDPAVAKEGEDVVDPITGPVGELRVPTKFASAKFNKQSSQQQQTTSATTTAKKNDLFESLSESAEAAGAPVAINRVPPTSDPVTSPRSKDEEDGEDEEYDESDELSTILTRNERRGLTAAQRATWRARQQDLTTRRNDLHGAATYAFDGIFVWQMYGSAEALDEFG